MEPLDVGNLEVKVAASRLRDETKGVVRVRVCTMPENKPMYNLDVSYVGLFRSEDSTILPFEDFLAGGGVTILVPFVRQILADVTQKGRFGPLWLDPINVVAMIVQARKAMPKSKRASKRLKKTTPRTKSKKKKK